MKVLLNVTVTQQQIQMTQNYRLHFNQRLFLGGKGEVGARQKLHEQEHQQMDGLPVGLLQVNDAMQAAGQVGLVRTAHIVYVAVCGSTSLGLDLVAMREGVTSRVLSIETILNQRRYLIV